MAGRAIVAPRGSPFLLSNDQLAPAWHHYLAQIEGLTKGLVATDQGAALAEIEAKVTLLESLTDAAEVELKKRNWGFFYTATPEPGTSGNQGTVTVNHDLNTRYLMSRAQHTSDATYTTQINEIIDENTVTHFFNTSGDPPGNPMFGWVLGFHGFE